MLRLKMVVNTVSRNCDNDGNTSSEEITMSAVYSDKEGAANKVWSQWTPCGNLRFTVTNPAAFGKILPGQFHYLDLTLTDRDSL